MRTYYYSQKLTATTTQANFDLPRLRSVRLLNYGGQDVVVEFEGDTNENSIVIPVRGEITVLTDMLNFTYKTNTGTSTLYLYGLRHSKE